MKNLIANLVSRFRTPSTADANYDPDVGLCIIAGCGNWCEDTLCRDHAKGRA